MKKSSDIVKLSQAIIVSHKQQNLLNKKINLMSKGISMIDVVETKFLKFQEINLKNNKIEKLAGIQYFSELKILNLSNNNIWDPKEFVILNQLPNLTHIYVSGNPFLNFEIKEDIRKLLRRFNNDIDIQNGKFIRGFGKNQQELLKYTWRNEIEINFIDNVFKKIDLHTELINEYSIQDYAELNYSYLILNKNKFFKKEEQNISQMQKFQEQARLLMKHLRISTFSEVLKCIIEKQLEKKKELIILIQKKNEVLNNLKRVGKKKEEKLQKSLKKTMVLKQSKNSQLFNRKYTNNIPSKGIYNKSSIEIKTTSKKINHKIQPIQTKIDGCQNIQLAPTLKKNINSGHYQNSKQTQKDSKIQLKCAKYWTQIENLQMKLKSVEQQNKILKQENAKLKSDLEYQKEIHMQNIEQLTIKNQELMKNMQNIKSEIEKRQKILYSKLENQYIYHIQQLQQKVQRLKNQCENNQQSKQSLEQLILIQKNQQILMKKHEDNIKARYFQLLFYKYTKQSKLNFRRNLNKFRQQQETKRKILKVFLKNKIINQYIKAKQNNINISNIFRTWKQLRFTDDNNSRCLKETNMNQVYWNNLLTNQKRNMSLVLNLPLKKISQCSQQNNVISQTSNQQNYQADNTQIDINYKKRLVDKYYKLWLQNYKDTRMKNENIINTNIILKCMNTIKNNLLRKRQLQKSLKKLAKKCYITKIFNQLQVKKCNQQKFSQLQKIFCMNALNKLYIFSKISKKTKFLIKISDNFQNRILNKFYSRIFQNWKYQSLKNKFTSYLERTNELHNIIQEIRQKEQRLIKLESLWKQQIEKKQQTIKIYESKFEEISYQLIEKDIKYQKLKALYQTTLTDIQTRQSEFFQIISKFQNIQSQEQKNANNLEPVIISKTDYYYSTDGMYKNTPESKQYLSYLSISHNNK